MMHKVEPHIHSATFQNGKPDSNQSKIQFLSEHEPAGLDSYKATEVRSLGETKMRPPKETKVDSTRVMTAAAPKPSLNRIQAASPRRHWIDAHDAIPPLNKRVLCRHESGCFYVAECRPCATNAAGYYWHLNAIGVSPEVTHWRNI